MSNTPPDGLQNFKWGQPQPAGAPSADPKTAPVPVPDPQEAPALKNFQWNIPKPGSLPARPQIPGGSGTTDKTRVQGFVQSEAKRLGIPPEIALNQARQESGFDQSQKNQKSGAVGVMQIVPLDHPEIKNPLDVNQNITGGLTYLKSLYKRYGNWTQALAAYDAGTGPVDSGAWLKFPETTDYVNKILGANAVTAFKMGASNKAVISPAPQPSFQWSIPTKGGHQVNQKVPVAPDPNDPTAGFNWWSLAVSGPLGAVRSLTGLPVEIGWDPRQKFQIFPSLGLTPQANRQWNAVTTKLGLKPSPNLIAMPENRTLEQLGEYAGLFLGARAATKLATEGAIKLGTSPVARTRAAQAISNLTPKAVSNYVKLALPPATGIGGQIALQQSVNQIFNNGGHFDPKKVGEEAALNAGVAFAFPAAIPLFGYGIKTSVSLAPELLKFLPIELGGFDEALSKTLKTTTVGQAVRAPFTAAANSLRAVYTGISRVNKGYAQQVTGLLKMANNMDNFIDTAVKKFQFPSNRWGGAFSMPHTSPLKPLDTMQLLDGHSENVPVTLPPSGKFPARIVRVNIGAGINGDQTHKALATQLFGLAKELRTSKNRLDATEGVQQRLTKAAAILNYNAGRMTPKLWGRVAANINSVQLLPDNTRLWVGRERLPTPETEYLGQLYKWAFDRSVFNTNTARSTRMLRSGVSHITLGLGNVASAVTVLNRLVFPLTSEGAEATSWGLLQQRDGTELAQRFSKAMGLDEPILGSRSFEGTEEAAEGAKTPPRPTVTSQIGKWVANKSFGLFQWSEKQTLPATAMAKYYNLLKTGVNESDAFTQALSYARQLRTTVNYDWPAIGGFGNMGNVIKVGLQFFPFAFKSAKFVSDLNLEDFSGYLGYAMAMGGLKGIPFLTVADRALATWTGHSIMNTVMGNPTLNHVLSGVPGLMFGIDVGSRHNWSNAYVERMLNLQPAPFERVSGSLVQSFMDVIDQPNGAGLIKAFKNSMPQSMQALSNALDDEYHGAILDRNSNVMVQNPTSQELARIALGFTPTSLSAMDAIKSAAYFAQTQQQRASRALEETYRRNLLSGNYSVPEGLSRLQQLRVQRSVFSNPVKNIIQRIPKSRRQQFEQFMQMFNR